MASRLQSARLKKSRSSTATCDRGPGGSARQAAGAGGRRGGGAHLDQGVVDLHVGLDEAAAAHDDVLGAPRQGAAQRAEQRGRRPGPHPLSAATARSQRCRKGRAGPGCAATAPPAGPEGSGRRPGMLRWSRPGPIPVMPLTRVIRPQLPLRNLCRRSWCQVTSTK